jgi:hypothetical protein
MSWCPVGYRLYNRLYVAEREHPPNPLSTMLRSRQIPLKVMRTSAGSLQQSYPNSAPGRGGVQTRVGHWVTAAARFREAMAIKRERLLALRAKRTASGRQSSGPNGLSRGCKVLCSRRLIRDRLGQYRGNGSCLRFWVHACSKWCGAVEV